MVRSNCSRKTRSRRQEFRSHATPLRQLSDNASSDTSVATTIPQPSAAVAVRPSRRTDDSGKTSSVAPRASRELIERTRQLMEKSIEFVPHVDFDRRNVLDVLRQLRPSSLDAPRVASKRERGIAFVSGLVEAPLLTAEEERYWFTWMNFLKYRAERNRRQLDLNRPNLDLVERIEADLKEAIEARNHIVQGNLRLIVGLAKKLAKSMDEMSDLISEGMTPLIRSTELFDISLGNKFSTYATWAVRNQMIRMLKRAWNSQESTLGEDAPAWENLPDRESVSDASEAAQELRVAAVQRLLASLPEREREIIAARFALDGQPNGQSLADIARQIGLSKERVRQIALNTLTKLRETISYDEFESIS